MESLQQLIHEKNHREIIRRFEVVKARLKDRNYYEWQFVKELERFVLEETDYKEGEM